MDISNFHINGKVQTASRIGRSHYTANFVSICTDSMVTQSQPRTQCDDKVECMLTRAQQPEAEVGVEPSGMQPLFLSIHVSVVSFWAGFQLCSVLLALCSYVNTNRKIVHHWDGGLCQGVGLQPQDYILKWSLCDNVVQIILWNNKKMGIKSSVTNDFLWQVITQRTTLLFLKVMQ